MAIAFDASSSSNKWNAGTNTTTFAHTCTGTNLVLDVGVLWLTSDGAGPTTFTYGGVSLTKVGATKDGELISIDFYHLVAPATGANNIIITFGGNRHFNVVAASYSGVAQTAPEASANGATTTPIAVAVTTLTNNAWTVEVSGQADGAFTVAGADTKRVEVTTGGDTAIFDSNAAITPAGSHTISASWTGSRQAAGIVVSLAPFAASTGTSNPLFFRGGFALG